MLTAVCNAILVTEIFVIDNQQLITPLSKIFFSKMWWSVQQFIVY